MNHPTTSHPPFQNGIFRQASDYLYHHPRATLALLLGPPLLWFAVMYLGALFALLANSFFRLDDYTGQVAILFG